jgi:chemotaxis protein MotB
MLRPRPALALGLALLAGGCVSKKKHDELEAVLKATRENLQDKRDEVDTLSADLESCGRRATATEAQLQACQEDRAKAIREAGELSDSVEEMTRALAEAARREREANARIAEYKAILAKFKSLIDAGRLKVKVVDGRLVVELATDILFGSGQAELSEDGAAAIREVAAILATLPGRRFQVEGHTDNVPISTARFPSNWELASARALSVVKTLIDGGMSPGQLSAASYSQYRPVEANDEAPGRSANRRIEIVMIPDLSKVPGFEELEAAAN